MHKNRLTKWGLSAIMVVIAAIVAAACDNNEPVGKQPKPVPAANVEKQEKPASEQKTYDIGEEIKLKNRAVLTVTNIEKSQGTETSSKPFNGKEYIIVTVQFQNIGKDDFDYASYDFSLMDKRGKLNEQDNLTTVDVDTYLHYGTLKKDESVTGTITFQRHIGEQGMKLFYQSRYAELPAAIINMP